LGSNLTVRFRCKDYFLKECEFEINGAHSADEMMKLVDVHMTEAHRTVKVSSETRDKIRRSMNHLTFGSLKRDGFQQKKEKG